MIKKGFFGTTYLLVSNPDNIILIRFLHSLIKSTPRRFIGGVSLLSKLVVKFQSKEKI